MAIGLVVYDLLYMILCFGLYGGALAVGARALVTGLQWVPWWLALFGAALATVLTLIAEVALLGALLPSLKPGRHALMKGSTFYVWILRSLLRRVLFVPGLKFILFSSNVLRFLSLRALGCRIAFTANVSTDADLLDPSLVTVGPGATIGARCLLSGHYVEDGQLVLGRISVGERSLLAVEVMVGPEAVIGARATVKGRTSVSIGAQIGDGAVVGGGVVLDAYCKVGPGARLGNLCYVASRAEVADGAEVPATERINRRAA